MNTVFEVARYVIEYFDESITTMKLQKLVYYCQAWALAWDGIPLFDEDFQAWSNGPVCKELYDKHKGKFSLGEDFLSDVNTKDRFNSDAIETMDAVLDYYGDKAPHWLSELTHQERPWLETRCGVPDGEPSSRVISKELMQEYYAGL